MTLIELEQVKQIINESLSIGCLCGRSESCSCCDGTESTVIHRIYTKLDKEFKMKIVEDKK